MIRPTPSIQDEMLNQYREVTSANMRSSKKPEIRFYDFIFLREKNDNSAFFSLLSNSPQWAGIAKKSSSDAFFVTDEATLNILQSQTLPAESGIKDKTYFDFLKESGFKFVTLDELIEKLPRDNAKWKNLYDKIDMLIDKGILHLASLRDLAKPIVIMGFKGDHSETVTIQKEPDIIVDEKLAIGFTHPNDILPKYKIQGIFNGVYIPSSDEFGVGRILIVQTKDAQEKGVFNKRQDLIKIFKDHQVTSSPEILARRGAWVYTGESLKGALKFIDDLIIIDKAISDRGIDSPLHQQTITINLASAFEKIAVINYGPESNTPNIDLDPEKFGIVGSILLNSWTTEGGGRNRGHLARLIADPSQISKVQNSQGRPRQISWRRINSLTDSANKDLEKSSLKSGTCQPDQSYGGRSLEFHPKDDAFQLPHITPLKVVAGLVAIAGAGLGAGAETKATSSLSSAHGSKPAIADLARQKIDSSLGRPSSAPAPNIHQQSFLKRQEDGIKK